MLQIRKSIFETNSSSSHAIVVKKESSAPEAKVDPKWRLDEEGMLVLYGNDLEFGRTPFELLTDWFGRLRYAIASLNDIEPFINICKRHVIGFKGFQFERQISLWDEEEDSEPCYGYVDHQSADLLAKFLNTKDVTLEDFVFNDRYIVVIDGDEYNILDDFINAGLLDENAVEDIVEALS